MKMIWKSATIWPKLDDVKIASVIAGLPICHCNNVEYGLKPFNVSPFGGGRGRMFS